MNISATILKSSLESESGSFSHRDLQKHTNTDAPPSTSWDRTRTTPTCCCPRSGWAWGKRRTGPCRALQTRPGSAARPPACPPYCLPSEAPLRRPPSPSFSSASPTWARSGSSAGPLGPCWWWAAHKLKQHEWNQHFLDAHREALRRHLTHRRFFSSTKPHRCRGCCWGSWGCCRGWGWGALRWRWCSSCFLRWSTGFQDLSPTSRTDSYTAWAAPPRSHEASPCSELQTPPCHWCPSWGRPAGAFLDTSPPLSLVLQELRKHPSQYSSFFLCTAVWVWRVSPARSLAVLVLNTEQGLCVLSLGSKKATGMAPARVARHWPRAGSCLGRTNATRQWVSHSVFCVEEHW